MFNNVRVPRNLYRTSMNYLHTIASAVYSVLIQRKIVDDTSFRVSLSAVNEKDITTTLTIDSLQKTRAISNRDLTSFKAALSVVNEKDITTVLTIDSLQKTRAISNRDLTSFRIILSALNLPFPSLTDSFYKKTEDFSNYYYNISGTNTSVDGVSALDRGISSVPKDRVTFSSSITKGTNTEVDRVSALDKGISSVPKDRVTFSSSITKGTNTEVDGVSALDKGISSVPKDRTATFAATSGYNADYYTLTSVMNGIPGEFVRPLTEYGMTFAATSGYNADYYTLTSVMNGIPGEFVRPLTEYANTFNATSGYNADYYTLTSVMNGIPGEFVRPLTEYATQLSLVSALNFRYETFEQFEQNSDTKTETVAYSDSLSGINSATSNFLILTNRYTDNDATSYINLVQQADGQTLETGLKNSIHEFVYMCKQYDLWNSISNCYIFSGAASLQGALIPLKGGVTLTNNGFTSSNYNRKRLQGNGISFLNLNVNSSTSNNFHALVHKTTSTGGIEYYFGDIVSGTTPSINMRSDGQTKQKTTALFSPTGVGERTGVHGLLRATSAGYVVRYNKQTSNPSGGSHIANASYTSQPLTLFKVGTNPASTVGLSFFSLGTSLDIVLYEELVNRLIYHTQAYST